MKVNNEKSISVVIPVFNGNIYLRELCRRLLPILQNSTELFEVILINDGSTDKSWQVIKQLAAEFDWVRGIDLMKNFGQHNAILCGIRKAHHNIIVTLDDDLQNPPEEIPKVLAKLEEGYDVVYGTPKVEQHGIWRGLASKITKSLLQGTMGAETARQISTYRVLRTRLREAFVNYQSPFVNIDVLLTWGTSRFAAIPVRHDPRPSGISNYTFKKLAVHALNMITGFSTLPLQMASLGGFALTLFGVGILAYVIGCYLLRGDSVPGFPFLASIVAIFSGAQLFALGIIGEYLARIHFRMIERPTYAIREIAMENELGDYQVAEKGSSTSLPSSPVITT